VHVVMELHVVAFKNHTAIIRREHTFPFVVRRSQNGVSHRGTVLDGRHDILQKHHAHTQLPVFHPEQTEGTPLAAVITCKGVTLT
jgi:hypothetical protein